MRPAAGAAAGLAALERVVQAHELEALARALLDHRAQPADALVPPVPEQLGVERAHDQATAGQPSIGRRRSPASRRRASVRATKSAACSRASASARAVVVGAAVVAPRVVVVDRVVVVVAVRPARRIAPLAPHERRSSRGRSARAARPTRRRADAGARGAPSPKRLVSSTQTARTPASSSAGSSHGAYAHSGSQKPPRQPRRRSGAGGTRCRCAAAVARPASVASSGRIAWVADEVHWAWRASAPSRSPPRMRKPLDAPARSRRHERSSSRASGSCPPARSPAASCAMGLAAHLVDERDEALERPAEPRAGRTAPASATASAAAPSSSRSSSGR